MRKGSRKSLLAAGLLSFCLMAGCASAAAPAQKESAATTLAVSSAESTANKTEAAADGQEATAFAEAQGFGGPVQVTLTVRDGVIVEAVVTGGQETEGVGSLAVEALPGRLTEAGSPDVDGVAGATVSSTAILTAARLAYAEATGEKTADAKMAPGIYEGKAAGFRQGHTIDVTVEVSETEILSVKVNHDTLADTVGIFDSVEAQMIPRILSCQSVAVESVSGATVSSNGVKMAVTEALTQALAAGGSVQEAISAFQEIPKKDMAVEEIKVDILIVGMGGAGTAAAVRAAELQYMDNPNDVSILAIDKAGRYGGMASLTADVFSVNPEKFQAEYNEGNDYCDEKELLADWLSYCEGDAKPENVESFIRNCGGVLDWMVYEHELNMAEPTTGLSAGDHRIVCFKFANADKGLTIRRQGTISFYDGMIESYTSMGGQYMLETEGYELLYDAETNKVTGCKARNNALGTEYMIYADAVIMATGGFGGNEAMEQEYLGNEYYPLKGGWKMVGMKQNTGQMIEAAIKIGAGTYNIDMCPMVHVAGSADFLTGFEYHDLGTYCGQTNQNTVWTDGDIPMYIGLQANTLAVDAQGRRFASEEGIAMLDPWKAGPYFYSIYSGDQIKELKENGLKYPGAKGASLNLGACGAIPEQTPLAEIEKVLAAAEEKGFVYSADTLEGLADILGADPETLKDTVEAYNGYCESGTDAEFGKDPIYLEKIGEGPYYAIKMASYCYSTCGALDINAQFEVLKTDGETAIGGLYAAGLDSMGVLMTNKKPYVTYGGVAEGYAYTSGYYAAENAVVYARTEKAE